MTLENLSIGRLVHWKYICHRGKNFKREFCNHQILVTSQPCLGQLLPLENNSIIENVRWKVFSSTYTAPHQFDYIDWL